MANLCFLKTEKVASTPHPLTLTGYPTPGKVVPPPPFFSFFFHEHDRKGCKRNYLNALGNFL